MLEKLFQLKNNGTNVRQEIYAGLTTFMTMAYILAVNPAILGVTGMDTGALFTATALASIVGTLLMAFMARYPIALAPGMGINAFFAYTVVIGMGISWQLALTAVFIEGIIFILLTLFSLRERIVNAIPKSIKHAISVGLGLFIALIGFQGSGIIVPNEATMIGIGNIASAPALIALFGLMFTGMLLIRKVKGALLIGMLAATLLGIPFGVTILPEGKPFSLPPSLEPSLFKFDFTAVFSYEFLIVLIVFLLTDMFDTVGTLIGVGVKSGFLDQDGKLPRARKALLADAIATTVGAAFGTSTTTAYVESATGVAEGGRTGLTSVAVAAMFIIALFFAPVFLTIPQAATAPVLILVGLFMATPIKEIDLEDYTEALPAFLTIITMPLTYSIADGIAFGVISYVLLKVLTGRYKQVSLLMVLLAVLFAVKLLVH
jgi:AGZA family xanthine/uracil permease-like MFS transporter